MGLKEQGRSEMIRSLIRNEGFFLTRKGQNSGASLVLPLISPHTKNPPPLYCSILLYRIFLCSPILDVVLCCRCLQLPPSHSAHPYPPLASSTLGEIKIVAGFFLVLSKKNKNRSVIVSWRFFGAFSLFPSIQPAIGWYGT